MEEKISKIKYLLITATLGLILVFNFSSWQNQIIGLVFTIAYFLFYSFIFGSIFIRRNGWETILGLIFLLALIIILGSFLIYFHQFNNYAIVILIFLVPVLLAVPYYYLRLEKKFSLRKKIKDYLNQFDKRREPKINFVLVAIYLFLASACFAFLTLGRTAESIQSPWEVVNKKFFFFYFLANAFLITYLFLAKRTKLPLFLLVIQTLLSTGVALIVYKIGYGFDPFIHQATEKIIAQTGQISPTPLYYLGQYALVIFISKLTFIDLNLIDRLLVPVLFSLLIPTIVFYVFSYWTKKQYAFVISLMMLAIPYSKFIMTAPQNLANLFFLITIFLSLLYFRNEIKAILLYLLALATLAIHPLAGIPLIITLLLLNLFKILYKSYSRYISLYILASLIFILFLPLAFMANGSTINLALPDFKKTDLQFFGWADKFDLPLNLAYLFNLNKILLAALIIIIGLWFINKNKLLKNNAGYLMAAFVIFIDFLITKYFLSFPELGDDDKNDFISRLLTLTFYILLPFFLIGLYWLIKKIFTQDIYNKIFLVFSLAGVMTVSFYLSYPRLNQYEPAKFFSLSASDLKAVNFIEQNANPKHIVLANQMIGAAAIKEFSFKNYYNNQFYYSMPMGTPRTFYEYFLEMIYQGAKRETMEKAMLEAGVNESYFVLNKYWNNSEKIAQAARDSADKIYEIDNGKIWIFKYSR